MNDMKDQDVLDIGQVLDEEFYEERLVTDLAFERERLRRALGDLDQLCTDHRDVIGESIHQWVSDSCEWIRQRMDDPFTIVLVGDFKRGKSTLVNAMLGIDAVPVSVTPETLTINRITYAREESLTALLQNKRKLQLHMQEAKRESLEKIISKLPSDIEYLAFGLPAELLKEIQIVDTPGVGDVLLRFDQQVQEYLTRADAVIDVVSAQSPLSETEQAFLCAAVLPQNLSKFFAVVNMCDALESRQDLERVTKMVRERLDRFIPQAVVFPISALDEVCRRKGVSPPNEALSDFLHDSFQTMMAQIQSQVIDKKEILLCERFSHLLSSLVQNVCMKLSLLESAMVLESDQQIKWIEDCENASSGLRLRIEEEKTVLRCAIREMREQTSSWMEEFLARVRQEIADASNLPLEQLEKHFHFYFLDAVREALSLCAQRHAAILTQKIEASIEQAWDQTGQLSLARTMSMVTTQLSWSSLDSATMGIHAIDTLLPELGILTLLGRAVMGYAKTKTAPKRASDYIGHILAHYDDICRQVMEQIGKIYENFIQKADEQLESGYESRMMETLEATRQAQSLSQGGEEHREQSAAVLRVIRQKLEQIGH